MRKITENDIENMAIDLLKAQGFQYFCGYDIAPDEPQALRTSYEEVLLENILQSAISRLNPNISPSVKEDSLNQIKRIHSEQLISGNENFHHKLIEGINVVIQTDSGRRGDYVRLIDFNNPENNEYHAINQFTVIEKGNHRPDIVLFVNGLPLIVMELKNPRDEKATLQSAYKQLQTFKKYIPSLFTYNSILIISDGLEAKAGSLSSGIDRFMAWKTVDGKKEAKQTVNQLETLIKGMLNKKTLLNIIRHFIVFEKTKTENKGITNIETIKKLSAYHQYYAASKALKSVVQASSDSGSRKGGVIWHTQGSGKSLTMVFAVGKIVQELNNPTIVVITDRNDLDNQLFDTFASSKNLLRQEPMQAQNREHLKELLKVKSGGIIFTTIQKFHPEDGNIYEKLSDRKNIVVIADEAHRSQYGFKAKIIENKDNEGKTTGHKTVYGFAKYMRDALPHATYLGFTGTPIEGTDKNTPAVFGHYVDVYDIAQAVEDKATVPISYESRLAKIELSQEGKKLIKDLDQELKEELSETQKSKAKLTQLEAIIGSEDRIKHIAKDIVDHFEKRQDVFKGKGMIVCMSRRIAVNLYNEIIHLRPKWHDDELNKGRIKVVMTASSSDGPEFCKHRTNKEQRHQLANRMKDPENSLHLALVVDMWLTGFDVPCLHTLYIDKPMQGHNLMQTIARVNRVYKDKPGGLIVDYLGIASDLKKALSFYSAGGGKGEPALPQEKAVSLMLEKFEIVSQMFHGFDYKQYFTADTSTKLSLILFAEEHILKLENGKKRFIDEVTALSKAFALSIPHEQALSIKDEVAFFQAVKARLVKFTGTGEGKTDVEIETVIRQVIDKALVSHQVIDVFSAAGIKKPDISILSEEFLLEVKNMKHKNIAIETLKKLLNDEIKGREKINIFQGKTLMEMLKNSIQKYHNKVITTVEVIDELIDIANKIKSSDKEHKKMELSSEEFAFYTAVSDSKSARELMGKKQLRELAVALTETIRKNASIDWQIKESVRANIRVMVRRTLKKYGYPPDMEKLAVDNVIKQAESIADNITQN